MIVRPFEEKDTVHLLQVLDKLIPTYFAPEERADYVHYLQLEREDYFVLEFENEVVAGGGVNYFLSERTARLSWDLVHPDFHGKNLGTELVHKRLELLQANDQIETIFVRTSQLAESFYQKQGFQRIDFQADFWGKGFDLVVMEFGIKN